MSLWKQWVKRRVAEGFADGDGPADRFRFDSDRDDFGSDHEGSCVELFKTVMSKYPEEAMSFFNTIATRGDEEVSALLRKVQRGSGPTLAKEPRHPSEREQIVSPMADRGFNPDGDGDT